MRDLNRNSIFVTCEKTKLSSKSRGHMLVPKIILWLMQVFIFFVFFSSCKKEKPNILLITIDTLRRDHVGAYGYPRQTTPFIDSLAKKGAVFKNVITPIPATGGSHTSILTSLHPVTHNVLANATVQEEKLETITEVLKKNGYYTIGTIAVYHMSKAYNFSQGFDSFSDNWRINSSFDNISSRVAGSVNRSLFRQIDEYNLKCKNKPLFIWVHYFDPHYPYIYRRNYACPEPIPKSALAKINSKKDINKLGYPNATKLIEAYDTEIKYADSAIKQLYFYLKKKGIARNMVTCIIADHGEQLGEHGLLGGHADFYTETIFVPLIFQGYKIHQNVKINNYASTMDIAVTLLDMVGLNFSGLTEGENLFKRKKSTKLPLKRMFFIVGNPIYTRSAQLIDSSSNYSYIKNFDTHLKFFYIDEKNVLPEARFLEFDPMALKIDNNNKRYKIVCPYSAKRGMNYLVLKMDFEKNKGFDICNAFETRIEYPKTCVKQYEKQLYFYYPITIMDDMTIELDLLPGTKINKLMYAYIAHDELLNILTASKTIKKMENTAFLKYCLTQRKDRSDDEVYDLSRDIQMENNLINNKLFKSGNFNFEGLIYDEYQNYLEKRKKIFLEKNRGQKYSKDEIENLKSLGYL